MTPKDAADFLAAQPKVYEFYVKEEHARDQVNRSKVPGGGGAWNPNLERSTRFEVFIGLKDGGGKAAGGKTIEEALNRSLTLNGL